MMRDGSKPILGGKVIGESNCPDNLLQYLDVEYEAPFSSAGVDGGDK